VFATQRATFTGSEPYVDVTFTDSFEHYKLEAVAYAPGASTAPAVVLSDLGAGVVRVTPVTAFTGKVDVTKLDVLDEACLPFVYAISPTAGHVGDTITIYGFYLGDATHVLLGNFDVAFAVVDDGTLTVVIPAGYLVAPVRVVTPAGTATGPTLGVL